MPNNRQIAVIIWSALILIYAMRSPDVRASLKALLKTAATKVILVPFGLFGGLVVALLWSASLVGLWNWQLLTDTAFWFVGSGVALCFSLNDVGSTDHFVRSTAAKLFGVAILIDVVLELSVMRLLFEIPLVVLATLFAGVEVVARGPKGDASVAKLANGVLITIGLVIASVGVWRIASDFSGHDWAHLGRQGLLAIWLTIGLLPLIYFLGLYVQYDSTWRRIDVFSGHRWLRRAVVKAAVAREFGFRARQLGLLSSGIPSVARAKWWGAARVAIAEHRQHLNEAQAEERARADRLEAYAGVPGTNSVGRQLDQREFDQTQTALRWLYNCHSGNWRHNNHYVVDLLDTISSPTSLSHLYPDAGYEELVDPQGKWWYAWRAAPSGWVFAIGANADPPDQWLFDGPAPPSGPPGVDPAWGDVPHDIACAPNWD
jgi:hypothetical protein